MAWQGWVNLAFSVMTIPHHNFDFNLFLRQPEINMLQLCAVDSMELSSDVRLGR